MFRNSDNAALIQRRYYTDTASQYDTMHAREAGDDQGSVRLVSAMLRMVEPQTVLDVGAGTGKGMLHLSGSLPNVSVCGIEPVAALIDRAVKKNGVPKGAIIQGTGEMLPFADGSFDAVCSFGLLHHVPSPNTVIREMARVARKAVVIVDSNRFGQGRGPVRWLKLALYKTKLWKLVNYTKTRGRGYLLTSGDGLAYSYSVYDSFDCIAEWADQLIVMPTVPCEATTWFHPLLTASHVLVCAIKQTELGGLGVRF